MKLIARKPCSFEGKKFYIGDEIPAEYVVSPKEQEKMGVLAVVADGAAPAPASAEVQTVEIEKITINVPVEEGELPLEITREGLQAAVMVMTGKAAEAEPVISEMTDGDALILLHLCDSRKAVKEAAEARAKALNESAADPEESAGEQ